MRVKTGAQVRQEFRRRGQTVRAWATQHGFSESLVHEVLSGRKKGCWGQAHQVAVLLGMKDGEIVNARAA